MIRYLHARSSRHTTGCAPLFLPLGTQALTGPPKRAKLLTNSIVGAAGWGGKEEEEVQ